MGYTVPDHISFCRDGGNTILLDLRRDWYFQLDAALEPVFVALVENEDPARDPEKLQQLLDLGVVEALAGDSIRPRPAACEAPTLSWRDTAPATAACGATPALFAVQAWASVQRARAQVRKVPFEQLIAHLRRRKRDRATPADGDADARLAAIAVQFARVRRGIPIDRICLQDSLALFDLCARRRLFPDFVIGVATSPFKAHCWLQSGSIVLNESLDCAQAFQPILVV